MRDQIQIDKERRENNPGRRNSEAKVDDIHQQDRRLKEDPADRMAHQPAQLVRALAGRSGVLLDVNRAALEAEPIEHEHVVAVPLTQQEIGVDNLSAEKAESAKPAVKVGAHELIEDPKVKAAQHQPDPGARAQVASSKHEVKAFIRLGDQPADGFGWILQVAVHDDRPVPIAGHQSRGDGCMLAKITAEADRLDVGVGPGKVFEDRPGAVRAAVVDKYQLIAWGDLLQRRGKSLVELGQAIPAAVHGNDDVQLHGVMIDAGLALGTVYAAIVAAMVGHTFPPGSIPFTLPSLQGQEELYMTEALTKGRLSGDGPFTKRCQQYLEESMGIQKALLVTSCTSALDMCALLLDIAAGDEVIVPSFTFVSSINAFALRGAKPVFADIRPDTLNIDESALESLITPRTKAIVIVHYAGVACAMDEIMAIADRHGIPVIEDNAHGPYARYEGRYLGTFGRLATLSFHETKNFTCGEGGALLLNDASLVERAEIIREKGTDRSRFFRGQVDKYTWVDIGSSYLPADLLAAMLLAQLEARPKIEATRRRIWEFYASNLSAWAAQQDVGLPSVPGNVEQVHHMFYLLLPTLDERQRLIEHLRDRQIQAAFHYQPLHMSRMGREFGGRQGDCPVSERAADTLVRLPFYNSLSDADLSRVVNAVREFRVSA